VTDRRESFGKAASNATGSNTRRQRSAIALPRLVDAETLAQSLGVGIRHVRRLVDERRIPFVKVGRYVRFDVEQIAAWVDANRVDQHRPALVRAPGR
jgi:excisionase family DNA binding protein